MDKKKKSHENNSLFISLASGLLPYAQKTFQIQCSFKIPLIVKKNLKTMMWLIILANLFPLIYLPFALQKFFLN